MRYITEKVCFKVNKEVFLFKRENFILLPEHITVYQTSLNEDGSLKLETMKNLIFFQKKDGGVYLSFPTVDKELDQVINAVLIALDLHEIWKMPYCCDFTVLSDEKEAKNPHNAGYPKTTELLSKEALDVLNKNQILLVKWIILRILAQLF